MIRRRVLGGVFKFKIDPDQMSFAYGIKKTLTNESYLYESGTVTGNVTITTINNKTFYKLGGRGEGLETIAFINFKTYKANQEVQIEYRVSSESPNDFLAVCKLDSVDKNNLAVKLSGTDATTYAVTVATPGSHYFKIYYYQHNDGITSGDNAGYFRLIPYYNQYEWGYDKPATQQTKIKSYYGWNLVSKPNWINLDKETDKAGTKMLTVEAQGNPGNERNGVVKLKEKRSDQEVELNISQEANPHPNDILLSLESIRFPSGTGSSTVNVTLIGNTSYSISNTPTGYSITGDGTGPITVQKTRSNTNEPKFRITGNAGTVKDVIVAQDTISCYCDCNTYDGCGCDVHTSFKHADITTCSNDTVASCPQHCAAYCTADTCTHNECICNCNQVNTCDTKCANCICDSEKVCVSDCNDICDCYTQCSHCAGDCNGVGCSCYTQCNDCAGDCNGVGCSCYTQCDNCSVNCSDTCDCYTQCDNCSVNCSDTCNCYTQCDDCGGHCDDTCNCYTQCNHCTDCDDTCNCYTQCNHCTDCADTCNCYTQCNHCTDCSDTCDCYTQCNNCAGHCSDRCDCYTQCGHCTSHCRNTISEEHEKCLHTFCGCDTKQGVFGKEEVPCPTNCNCITVCVSKTTYFNCPEDCQSDWNHTLICHDCLANEIKCNSDIETCSAYHETQITNCDTKDSCETNCVCYGVCPSEYCKTDTDGCSCDCYFKSRTYKDKCYCDCDEHEKTYKDSCSCDCDEHGRTYKDSCSCDCDEHGRTYKDSCYCDCDEHKRTYKDSCSCDCDKHGITYNDPCSCDCNAKTGTTKDSCYCDCDEHRITYNDSCYCDCNAKKGTAKDSCYCDCDEHKRTYKDTCSSHCIGHDTTTKDTCSSHCIGHDTTSPDTCQCDCNDHEISCSTYDECSCNTNVGTCGGHQCQSDVKTCTCNQKTYYPYCDCDQYCKCDGYEIPNVT